MPLASNWARSASGTLSVKLLGETSAGSADVTDVSERENNWSPLTPSSDSVSILRSLVEFTISKNSAFASIPRPRNFSRLAWTESTPQNCSSLLPKIESSSETSVPVVETRINRPAADPTFPSQISSSVALTSSVRRVSVVSPVSGSVTDSTVRTASPRSEISASGSPSAL